MLSATGAVAASSGSPLGVDYSEWIIPYEAATQIATDSAGALYILSGCPIAGPSSLCVTKLSADGKTILWRNGLGFVAARMAVDAAGGVYVIPVSQSGDSSIYVAKLSADGTGIAWKTPVGFIPPSSLAGWLPVLAADSQGRAYVAAPYDSTNDKADVVRLNVAGSAVDYTAQVKGTPTSIAVDGSGAAFVAGYSRGASTGFLARLAPDGSAGFYSTLPQDSYPAVALDSGGNAVVFGAGLLQRLDSTGTVTLSTTVLGGGSLFALDAAGNAYITGLTDQLYPVRNSLATCGWNLPSALPVSAPETADLLTVIGPDGSLLESTYIPGASFYPAPLVAAGPNSTVFVVATAGTDFAPTQAGPFPAGETGMSFLLRLSPTTNARTVSLACVGNAATYGTGRIAPGEIVTLIGDGLGPQQGIATQATLQRPFPTQAANVEVTFDGTPAPLLWVQDAQINVVAPWSLTPGQTTQVCVSYIGVKTNCLTWPVVETAPAVFTVDGLHAAALNQDGTINSADNPAVPGSIVSVFATGLGPITTPQADGTLVGLPLPNNVLQVGVEAKWVTPGIPFGGGETAPFVVTYAGPAPYLVAGASQVNFRMVPYHAGPPYGGQIYVSLPSTSSQAFQVYVAGQ
jgi:uncharacterized protein (TIGR03437 family)